LWVRFPPLPLSRVKFLDLNTGVSFHFNEVLSHGEC